MRKWALLATLLPLLAAASPARAAAAPPTFVGPCPLYGDLRICSGEVASFDGSRLDVDLTEPIAGSGRRHPLIVLAHGFGNNKHEWESTTDEADGADKWHWNSHWFASHGYYVLTYTARGFRDRGPSAPYQPATPSGSSDMPADLYASIHLKSVEFEIRDTQWLSALAARSHPDLEADEVAISGGSYGGGESWSQAAQPTWNFPHSVDPDLPVLHLQVAVPKYPWTDLAYSLAPNGHGGGPSGGDLYESSQGLPGNPEADDNPFGVAKQSYIGLFTTYGNLYGRFNQGPPAPYSREEAPPPVGDGPVVTDAWVARATTDPYPRADPIVRQIRRGLTIFRGSYYQWESWAEQAATRHETAVFSISGWTDDLFPPIESFRQFKYLKRLDPLWPVEVAVADIGHPRAQNKPEAWQPLNEQAWSFLQANIERSHRASTTVSSQATTCAGFSPAAGGTPRVVASSPEGLSAGTLTVSFSGGDFLDQASGTGDPDGVNTDAIAATASGTGMCRASLAAIFPTRWSGVSGPLAGSLLYVGLGRVEVPYTLAGGTATLDARVWDVAPDGRQMLVTRGAYRLDVSASDAGRPDPPAGTLRLPFHGNEWALGPGHRLRLDLAEVDGPTYQGDRTPNTLVIGSPTLVLPLREAVQLDLAGTQTSS